MRVSYRSDGEAWSFMNVALQLSSKVVGHGLRFKV